ncbi:MAG: CoA transferase [Chloroflexi bacterium]|nr:CoA transferase [Chloroflexota bacterium]
MAFGLEGIKVIETASIAAGPMAGRFLADWGADVIRIENPLRLDELRNTQATPPRPGRPVGIIASNINYTEENHNRNKRGITLDLAHDGGREVLYRLLEKADVFLVNFRPYELKKFKLEYETLSQLNPRLIQANLTGYGKKGAERDAGANDYLTFWGRSGFMHVLTKPGMTPLLTPGTAGDRLSGMALALGIMAALYIRERTGVGQEVDVSLYQMGVFAISADMAGALVTGQDLQQLDRKDVANALATFYQTKDGKWLRLAITTEENLRHWARVCQALEREDLVNDPRFASIESIMDNHDTLFNIMEGVFLTKTLEEWKVRLNELRRETGLRWDPVQSLPEVIADPQAKANDFFVAYDHPTYGRIDLVANPVKLSQTPERIRMPAPQHGQHTEEVLLEYGYTWHDIERFKEQGIIA